MTTPKTTTTLTPPERARNAGRASAAIQDMRALGKKGGRATAQKYGASHMSDIGKRGLARRIENRWGGDRVAYLTWFVAAGQAALDPFPANGAFPNPGTEPNPAAVVTPERWIAFFHPTDE